MMHEYQILIRWKSGHGPVICDSNGRNAYHNDRDSDHFTAVKAYALESAKFVSTLGNVIDTSVIECKSGYRWDFSNGEITAVITDKGNYREMRTP